MKKQLLLFILTLLPMLAIADDSGSCGDNVTYTFVSSTGTLTIQGSGAMKDYSSFTSVPWYSYRNNIKNMVISEGITTVGERACIGCANLVSVSLPNSLISIEDYAFEDCSSLTSVTIPNSVTSIGNSAFSYCSGLTSVTIGNSVASIGSYAFENCTGLTSITIPNSVTSIGSSAFWGCSGLTSVTIPNSVTSIGGWAFYNCSGLTSVTIPNSVTSIGGSAFNGCSGLTSIELHCPQIGLWFKGMTSIKEVVIGNEVTSIGSDAFNGCSGLTSVTIPNSVTSIGSSAFSGCSGLTSVIIPNSVTSIGEDAFYGCSCLTSVEFHCAQIGSWFSNMTSIEEVIIGNEVTSIGEYAFYGCSSIASVIIGKSVTSIGYQAFYGCSGLTSVTIKSNDILSKDYSSQFSIKDIFGNNVKKYTISEEVTGIGNCAFRGCSSLASINIPNSVTSIGSDAFYGCSGLTSITIPNSVTSIGSRVCEGCSYNLTVTINNDNILSKDYSSQFSIKNIFGNNVKKYTIGEEVTSIGKHAFYGYSGLTSVTIPNSVTSIGGYAFYGCSGLQKVIIPDIAAWCGISFGDNPLEYAHHIYSDENTEIKELVIPDGVTSIGSRAFSRCSGLTSVTIPNSVTSIGSRAFYSCSGLTSVTIPNSVTSIGDYVFFGCSSLTSVTIPNSVTSIGDHAFYGCSGLTSVTIPNSVTSIGNSAFSGCSSLASINIPNSVTSIGNYAFYGCSSLTSVTIPNSVTSIGQEAFSGSPWWTNYSADPANHYGNIIYINFVAYKAISSTITSCEFKEGTISIGNYAFSSCKGLTSVTIPNSVKSIGNYAFSSCKGLTSVTIPNSVKSIGKYAFEKCFGLNKVIVPDIAAWCGIGFTEYFCNPLYYAQHIYSDENTEIKDLVIPNSVTNIGNLAFINCSNLTSVTIPNSVSSIGSEAFAGCNNLTSIYCMIEDAFTITNDTFDDATYSKVKLYVPIGKKAAYQSADGWKNFTNIEEFDFTPKYKLAYMVDGVEYKSYELEYGATITPEPAPTKEGYTFSGWSEIPETMPAHDVTVTGTFSINKYKLTYKVDGVEYKSYELEYGATITPEPTPTKEGYTFSGWSEIPETMPAYDVTVTGSFAVNQYLITYMIGDEVYQKEYVDYGATIVLPYVPEREGYSFAWIDAPEKMPAHDITINGAYTSGIWGVSNDDATTNTYTTGGYKTDKPRRGVNIIRMSDGTTRKVVVK